MKYENLSIDISKVNMKYENQCECKIYHIKANKNACINVGRQQ